MIGIPNGINIITNPAHKVSDSISLAAYHHNLNNRLNACRHVHIDGGEEFNGKRNNVIATISEGNGRSKRITFVLSLHATPYIDL